MSKNTKRLKENIIFFLGIGILDLFDFENVWSLIITLADILFLFSCYMLVKQQHEKSGLICILLGLFQVGLGVIYAVNLGLNLNTLDTTEKIVAAVIVSLQIVIGSIITYEAVKYNKELKGEL